MSEGTAVRTAESASPAGDVPGHEKPFVAAPLRVRVFVSVVVAAAVTLPFVMHALDEDVHTSIDVLTAVVLVLLSVLHVELTRRLSGGVRADNQPQALSAWAFACALLLPTTWLLLVVPLTCAHSWWRGVRAASWRWVGAAACLVVAALAADVVRHVTMGDETNWMAGAGGRGLVSMMLAAVAFLVVETILFGIIAWLGTARDEVWVRRVLVGPGFYVGEGLVLLLGGLFSAVWTGGGWFAVFFLPIYVLAARAALHGPLRQRAEAAAELAVRNRDLETANQFKIDLMGVLGHEIGNPVTAILLHSEMAREDLENGIVPDRDDLLHTCRVVERNALQVRRVLNDLLVLVGSDNDALQAHPEPTTLRGFLVAAADSQPPEARPEVTCPPDLQALVQPVHLDQMLANLLSNATKYGGGARVLTAERTGDGTVEVTVADDGPGVPEDFRPHLFEKFSREAESAGKVRGTGLGLYITRELAQANRGEVFLRPTPRGARFVLVLGDAST